MKRVLGIMIVVSLSWYCASAENEPSEKSEVLTPLRGFYGQVAEVSALTPAQIVKIAEIQDAQQKAIDDLNAKSKESIAAIMTPEQKAKWNGQFMLKRIQREFKSATFTADQLTKIAACILENTKGTLIAEDRASWEASRKIIAFTRDQILTEEQKAVIIKEQEARRKQLREAAEKKHGEKSE